LTTVDARGKTTTSAYDVMGRLTKWTDALAKVSSMTYNAAGLELTETDANGNVTSLIYDGFNRGLVATTLEAAGSTVQASSLSSYDAAGNDVSDRNADGWWSSTSYDAMDRPLTTGESSVRRELPVRRRGTLTPGNRDMRVGPCRQDSKWPGVQLCLSENHASSLAEALIKSKHFSMLLRVYIHEVR
jgi:YD repeat-containing protein